MILLIAALQSECNNDFHADVPRGVHAIILIGSSMSVQRAE